MKVDRAITIVSILISVIALLMSFTGVGYLGAGGAFVLVGVVMLIILSARLLSFDKSVLPIIATVCLTVALMSFLIAAYFVTPSMTNDQRAVMRSLFSLLAGFATAFWGAAVFNKLDTPMSESLRITLTGLVGLAVFVLTYLQAPYWNLQGGPEATRPPLYRASFAQFGNDSRPCVEHAVVGSEFHISLGCHRSQGSTLIPATYADMDLQMSTRKVSGSDRSGYGILLVARGDTYNRQHRFFVSGIGNYTYEVASYDQDGRQIDLNIVEPYTHAQSIRQGNDSNDLRVVRRGKVIEFSSNGQILLVTTTTLGETEAVRPGLQVVTPQNGEGDDRVEVAFTDLTIYPVR